MHRRALSPAAPSKLNGKALVPTTPPTLTISRSPTLRCTEPGKHCRLVADDHAVVLQSTVDPNVAEAVRHDEPNISPLIVTDTPPLTATFTPLVKLPTGAARPKAHSEPIQHHAQAHASRFPPPGMRCPVPRP